VPRPGRGQAGPGPHASAGDSSRAAPRNNRGRAALLAPASRRVGRATGGKFENGILSLGGLSLRYVVITIDVV